MTSCARIAGVYIDVLANRMGLEPRHEGGLVNFETRHGLRAAVALHESKPHLLHLFIGFNASEDELGITDGTLEQLCAKWNRREVVKVLLDDDGDLIVSAEQYVADRNCLPFPEHVQCVLPQLLDTMLEVVDGVTDEIKFEMIIAQGKAKESSQPRSTGPAMDIG